MATMLGLVLATLGLGPSPASAEANAEAPAAVDEPVRHAVVLDGTIDPGERLPDELALRLGDRSIGSARSLVTVPEGPYVWVAVDEVRPGAAEIRLIVSDGRLYARTVEAPAEQRARVVAGTVANMLDAIENNRLAPQRTGVTVPVPVARSEPQEPPTSSKRSTPPGDGSGSVSPPSPPPSNPSDPLPRTWLGVVAGGGATFGLGPPTASAGTTGLGGGLGVQAVLRRGAVVGLHARATRWRSHGVSLSRVRVAAVAGYAWRARGTDARPSRFELLGAAGPTMEVIHVDAELVAADRSRRRIAPLVGACLLVRPMVTIAEPRGARVSLGIQVEAAVAVEARAPAGAVQLERAAAETTEPIARAGGFELETAAVVEARFGLGRRGG